MAGGEAPDKVKRANDVRYLEYTKIVKIERRLRRKILEDPGPRPAIPEPGVHPGIPGGHARERCGACDPCTAQNCGRCGSCREEGPAITGARDQGGEHRKGASQSREDV